MQPRLLVLALCFAAMLGGCGGKDYTYVDGRDLKEGPGLFTGKDGTFTLYSTDKTSPEEKAPAGKSTDKQKVPKTF